MQEIVLLISHIALWLLMVLALWMGAKNAMNLQATATSFVGALNNLSDRIRDLEAANRKGESTDDSARNNVDREPIPGAGEWPGADGLDDPLAR